MIFLAEWGFQISLSDRRQGGAGVWEYEGESEIPPEWNWGQIPKNSANGKTEDVSKWLFTVENDGFSQNNVAVTQSVPKCLQWGDW